MSGDKEKPVPTEEVDGQVLPASIGKPVGERSSVTDEGGGAGLYHPSEDNTPTKIEVPNTSPDAEDITPEEPKTEEVDSLPDGGDAAEEPSYQGDFDGDSCAEEGGVPHDILALYDKVPCLEEEPDGEPYVEELEELPPLSGTEEESTSGASEEFTLEAPEVLIRRITRRYSAKFIDFMVAALLYQVPGIVGPLAATVYVALSDGISGGSIGKRAAGGLKVVSSLRGGEACGFKDSILRNSLFAILVPAFFLFGWIPYFGKLAVFVVGLIVIVYEGSLLYKERNSTRIGDTLAGTKVIESEPVDSLPHESA